jgi:quercetin dioxygenase-like cupin family protein
VIAATKLASVTDKPLYFRAVSIALPPGAQQAVSIEDGILYQLAGSAEVSASSETSTLNAGSGMLAAGGKSISLRSSGAEPSLSLYFELTGKDAAQAPSSNEKELFRTTQPIAGLKRGPYDLNLTRVTFPAQLPSNAPHHRTGAALYYIVSGSGANTIDGKTETKGPGSLIYEPNGLVHQWGNPGAIPMTFLTFNINQVGVPAVASDAPAKGQ